MYAGPSYPALLTLRKQGQNERQRIHSWLQVVRLTKKGRERNTKRKSKNRFQLPTQWRRRRARLDFCLFPVSSSNLETQPLNRSTPTTIHIRVYKKWIQCVGTVTVTVTVECIAVTFCAKVIRRRDTISASAINFSRSALLLLAN